MTKQELDTLGYTYTNLTSGYVGVDYAVLHGAGEETVSELLKTLAPEITEANLIDILIGLEEAGVSNGYVKKTVTVPAAEELPEHLPKRLANRYRLECEMQKVGVYKTDYLCYDYKIGNKTQKQSSLSQQNAKYLKKKLEALAEKKSLSIEALEKIIRSLKQMPKEDNISIAFYRIYPPKNTAILYNFNRKGMQEKTTYVSGVVTEKQSYKKNSITETQLENGQPVNIRKNILGRTGVEEVVVTVPVYEGAVLSRSKTTCSKRLAEGLQPFCFVHRSYDAKGVLAKVRINDAKYGKKSYTFLENGFEAEENGDIVSYTGQVYVSDPKDPMRALKELMDLDGALIQLKKYVEEYKMDYKKAFDEIYTQKIAYATTAMNERKAVLYIADRGNMTIYDTDHKKAAYFPIEIIKNSLPAYRNYPNVMVEQKMKESRDPEVLRRLYDFGSNTTGKDAVYAFQRVVKALSANPATPADILARIVDGIYAGKYDNANLAAISANPNADTETLQVIIDHKPSILVLKHVEDHPNRPIQIKARVSAKEAQNAAASIFGNG